MATKMIGIDLGQREVRAWQLDVSFSKRESTASLRRPIEPLEGEEHLDAQLRTASELLDREDLSREAYALAIPRSVTSILTHRLPSAQLKMLDEILPGELEDLLPFDSDDLFYDYQITHQGEDELELLIAYTLRDEFDDFMARCAAVGLDPKVITLGGIYTHHLTAELNAQSGESSPPRDIVANESLGDDAIEPLEPPKLRALLDIGESGAEWVIYHQERLYHIQRADVGGAAITRALAKAFRVDDESAEQGKVSEARWIREDALDLVADGDAKQLARAFNGVIEESLAPLLGELGRSFAYCERRYGLTVSHIDLMGECARLKGLGQLLTDRLMVDVRALSTPEELKRVSTADGSQDYLAFAMAQGLAKRLYTRSINLRKGDHQYAGDSGVVRSLIVALLLTLFAIASLQGARVYFEHQEALAELASLELEVNRLGQELFGSEGMELDTIKSNVESAKRAKVLIPEESAFSVLKDLSTHIERQPNLELDKLSISLNPSGRGSLTLAGKAVKIGDVSMILEAVKQSPCFSERAKREKTTNAMDGRKSFRITSSSTCQ